MPKQLSAQVMLDTSNRIKDLVADFFPTVNNAQLFVESNGNSLNEQEISKFSDTSDVIYDRAEFMIEDDKINIKDDGTIDTLFLFNQEQLNALNQMVTIFLDTFDD